MYFSVVREDLFSMPDDYFLAHCISADAKMGAGIAVEFEKRFNLREVLAVMPLTAPQCVRVGRVLNLVTKEMYWHKPTLESLSVALEDMRLELCEYLECSVDPLVKVAMPKIGCGLDRLKWPDVEALIEKVFSDFNGEIKIVICEL